MPTRDPRRTPVKGDNLRNEKGNKNHIVAEVGSDGVSYAWFNYESHTSGSLVVTLQRWEEMHAFWTIVAFGDNLV